MAKRKTKRISGIKHLLVGWRRENGMWIDASDEHAFVTKEEVLNYLASLNSSKQ